MFPGLDLYSTYAYPAQHLIAAATGSTADDQDYLDYLDDLDGLYDLHDLYDVYDLDYLDRCLSEAWNGHKTKFSPVSWRDLAGMWTHPLCGYLFVPDRAAA